MFHVPPGLVVAATPCTPPYLTRAHSHCHRLLGAREGLWAVTVISYVVPPLLPAMFEWFWNILYNLGTSDVSAAALRLVLKEGTSSLFFTATQVLAVLLVPLQTARVARR